jgi:drug/metabolite transporter (DMT)-like permease
MSATTVGLLFGVTSSLAFGASGPFAKALIDAGFSPLQAVWLRIVGAVLILGAGCAVSAPRRRALPEAFRRHGRLVVAYGLVAVASCQALYFVAASRLPVGVAILLEFTGPVLVVGWVRLVRRQHVARVSVAGVLIALAGLGCVVQIWSGVHLDAVGIAAGLGAGAGNASYFLLIDRLTGAVDPLTLTTGGMVVGAVALLPLAAPWSAPWHILGQDIALGGSTAPAWLLAAALVLISTVLSYLTGAAAIQRLSATAAAALAYVEPAAATVIAWLALDERLAAPQLVGGLIVLTGAFLAQRGVSASAVDASADAATSADAAAANAAAAIGSSFGEATDTPLIALP